MLVMLTLLQSILASLQSAGNSFSAPSFAGAAERLAFEVLRRS